MVGATGTGTVFFSSSFFSSSFVLDFGFGAGTGGAIGFPVDVFPAFPAETVTELVEIEVFFSSSFSFLVSSSCFFSTFSTSSLPPGRVTTVALASFSAVSTFFFYSSIFSVNFLTFSVVFSTTSASFESASLQILVESSRSF